MVSCCCGILNAGNISADLSKAGRRQFCVKCHSIHENRGRGWKSPSRGVAEPTDTRKKIEKVQPKAASVSVMSRSTRRQEIQSKTADLLSKRSLAE